MFFLFIITNQFIFSISTSIRGSLVLVAIHLQARALGWTPSHPWIAPAIATRHTPESIGLVPKLLMQSIQGCGLEVSLPCWVCALHHALVHWGVHRARHVELVVGVLVVVGWLLQILGLLLLQNLLLYIKFIVWWNFTVIHGLARLNKTCRLLVADLLVGVLLGV